MAAKIGILLSGAGSTYRNLVAAIERDDIDAEIAMVVSSRADVKGVALAESNGHPVKICLNPMSVTAALNSAGVEWVVMCGYMRFWNPPQQYAERTINMHPSLLPSFGGRGMYGSRVHRAVIAAGCRVSGCTVHLVSGEYDTGPIIAQQAVEITYHDDADSLEAKVKAAERVLYPEVLKALLAGRLTRDAAGVYRLDYDIEACQQRVEAACISLSN